jgi:hypothetical protein
MLITFNTLPACSTPLKKTRSTQGAVTCLRHLATTAVPPSAAPGPNARVVQVSSNVGMSLAGGGIIKERSESLEEHHGGQARWTSVSVCSLAFKRWAQGRCYRCLARDYLVRDCHESFRCFGCLHLGHRERDCRRRPAKPDGPSCDLRNLPLGHLMLARGPRLWRCRPWEVIPYFAVAT